MAFKLAYLSLFLAFFVATTLSCNTSRVDRSKIIKPRVGGPCSPIGAYTGTFPNMDGKNEYTCCCGHGCCYNNCKWQIPPEGKCVSYFDSATWNWDPKHEFWVLTDGPKDSLIPKKPSSGCPSGTHSYYGTCCCEDGCCWNNCRSADPNNHGNCLKGTDAIWVRNSAKGIWVAQIESKA